MTDRSRSGAGGEVVAMEGAASSSAAGETTSGDDVNDGMGGSV